MTPSWPYTSSGNSDGAMPSSVSFCFRAGSRAPSCREATCGRFCVCFGMVSMMLSYDARGRAG